MVGMGLEERVRGNVPARVVVLEDNQSERHLFKLKLNELAGPHNYGVTASIDPDEVFRLATQDTRIWAVVLDLFLKDTPPTMKSRFENGLAVAKAIKEVRKSSIDVILMSGLSGIADERERNTIERYLGEHYLESLSRADYVDAWWEKSVYLLEEIPKLFGIVHERVSRRQLLFPKFTRAYLVAGERGAGKDSSAGLLNRQMLHAYSVSPPTTRLYLRPSEILDETVPLLYRRLDRERMTLKQMQERARATENPLIWLDDGPLLAKDAFLKLSDAASRDQYHYMLDPNELEKKLEEGDVLVTIRNVNALEALKRFFKERAHVIFLQAGPLARARRIAEERRPGSELSKVSMGWGDESYLRLADTVIKTELEFLLGRDLDDKQRRMAAIDEVSRRISEVVESGRKTPYGVSPAKMHGEYLRKIERALCARAGTSKLKLGSEIEIPWDTKAEYQQKNMGRGVEFLSLIPNISSARVEEIVNDGGIRRIRLSAGEMAKAPLEAGIYRPWNDVLEGLIGHRLKQDGFHPSQTRNIFPYGESQYQGFPLYPKISNLLVYAETDAPPPSAKGKSAMPYRLELVFG